MKAPLALLSCLVLVGCPSGNTPAPSAPLAVCAVNSQTRFPSVKAYQNRFCYDDSEAKVDISQLPIFYDRARAQTTAIRPNVNLDTPFPLTDTIFKFMPSQMVGPNGNPGFYADAILDPVSVEKIKDLYPTSVDASGRLGLTGYTDTTGSPIIVYALAANLAVVRHESLHLIWYSFFGSEGCPGTLIQTWAVVEHGVACDPFKPHE